jgi:NADPH2:quinone reductase
MRRSSHTGPDLPTRFEKVSKGRKAGVVSDGVGKTTFAASLAGRRHQYAQREEIAILDAFCTRPSRDRSGGVPLRVQDVFDAVSKDIIKPSVWKHFALADVTDAHALDNGAAGAIVLKP